MENAAWREREAAPACAACSLAQAAITTLSARVSRGLGERIISLKDLTELEPVRDEQFRINRLRRRPLQEQSES